MHRVMVAGAGKIGTLISCMLIESGQYEVIVVDQDFSGADIKRLLALHPELKTLMLSVEDPSALSELIRHHKVTAIISSLPYFVNIPVAMAAKESAIHYFDLTEDTQVTAKVKILAENAHQAFVPQCGLAPGFIGIVANHLMKNFQKLDTVKLRVGALPENSNNALHYALTWSTEGLINQYGNPCHGINQGIAVNLRPLEDLEMIQIDGLSYEAFNTSGGLGSLASSYVGKVNTLNYKTIRYPGHCEKMRVLMDDLKLNDDRDTLKKILERAIPKTYQDVVLVYVAVTGDKEGNFVEENYVKKIYPHTIAGLTWSAIQITTASGICGVVDIVLNNPEKYRGLVLQENIDLSDFLDNPFGQYYR